MALPEISSKMNRVLGIILTAFLAIVIRIWHLGVIQREDKLLEAQKPQQRTILLKADRGTICDRFHIPLALNRICYNAAIYYAQIAQIPTVVWKTDERGKQVKSYARKEYIRELGAVLADALHLDAERIEDLIYSKASLFPHVPYILKAGITEDEHYRLRMLEKDWHGIHAEIAAERFYPLGKAACSIIGMMGSINQKEYTAIAQELKELQESVSLYEQGFGLEADYKRLQELKEKAYTASDLVGKTGIERQMEERLRGFYGKKTFEVDQKGRFLRELPGGRAAIPGQQVVLTLSSELQQFAEELLAKDEKTRDGRSLGLDPADKTRKVQKQPWIKGGAIVAIDPKTGEVIALASYPRFDPNDFIPSANALLKSGRQWQMRRWLENERFIGAVWDGNECLMRERVQEEIKPLTWDFYLDLILPEEGYLRTFFQKVDDVRGAIHVQEDFEALLYESKLPPTEAVTPDKLFATDLCRMAVYSPAFSDALIAQVGSMKLGTYHLLRQAFQRLETDLRDRCHEEFRVREFRAWREENQKEFLAEKRKIEKENKSYARPYLDYLDQKERELFAVYWEEKRLPLILQEVKREPLLRDVCNKLTAELGIEFLRTFRSFDQLDRPLYGKYKTLRNRDQQQTEKDLAAAFYPIGGFGFGRSFAFQTGAPQGSIFKLVTAYEALRQGRTITIVDEIKGDSVAQTLDNTSYPRIYKGGRLPRSHKAQIGKIDLVGALEQTSNPYFSILAGDCLQHPEDLSAAASAFGFGEKTGIELPGESKGNVPNDLKRNRTGLYSTAIGQHTLLTTPLQTACMLSTIANGGQLLKPKIIKEAAGFSPDMQPLSAFSAPDYFAKEELNALGIQFPLFTAVQPRSPLPDTVKQTTEIRRTLPMTNQVRSNLLEGMNRVVWGAKGTARPSIIRALIGNPRLMGDYLSLQNQLVGKTSTAEFLFNPHFCPSSLPQMYKHIWFGSIVFGQTIFRDPELVVVVFLRYGDGGKEAAPLATQVIRKWREIKGKHK